MATKATPDVPRISAAGGHVMATPSVTSCPEWCELTAGHPFDERNVLTTDDYGRTHSRRVGDVDVYWTEVVPESSAQRPPVVDMDRIDITSIDEAEELIANIRQAATLAFGEVTR